MALSFNEIDQYLTLADNAALTLPDADWSVSLWMKPLSLAGTVSQFIISWNHFDTAPSFNWWFREASHSSEPGKLRFRLKDAAGDQIEVGSPTAVIVTVAWHHLCLVRSGNTFTQYVNGVAAGATTTPNINVVNASVNLILGAVNGLDAVYFFNGLLADVAKWNRALSSDEITGLSGGKSVLWYPTSLAWHCPFKADLAEKIVPLSIADHSGGLSAEHPALTDPGGPFPHFLRRAMRGGMIGMGV